MAVRNDSILLENGSYIDLRTWTLYQASPNLYALAKGTNSPPSVLDLRNRVDLLSLVATAEGFVTNFAQMRTAAQIASQEYQTLKMEFKNSTRFLWGSLEKGGCYVRKIVGNKYRIGGVTGFFEHDATPEKLYYYLIQESDNYELSDLKDCCFLYRDVYVENEYPELYLFTTGGMGTIPDFEPIRASTYYAYYTRTLPSAYEWHNMFDMYEPTRYITWEGVLGDQPTCYWRQNPDYDGQFPHNIYDLILGGHDIVDTCISGDIWGGQLADEEEDPNEEGGTSAEDGGNGDYPSETGNVDTPDSTSLTVDCVNSGFVTLYNPTLGVVKSFNDFLFTDITEVLSVQLKRLIANPLDYVLFLAQVHFTPPSTADAVIQYAGINTNLTAHKISKQFHKIECGTVHIDGDTQTFLDYNNNTRVSIYLPYVGIKELNTDDIIGSDVKVTYNIDMMTGSCLVSIHCQRDLRNQKGDAKLNDVIYTFSGNCFETWALTGTDWRNLYTSTINLISGAAAVAGGNFAGIGSMANAIMSEKVSVQKSGNMSGSVAYMDTQYPYIILERPINNIPYHYNTFKGYALNMWYTLGNLKGYTEIEADTLWVNGMNGILEEEANMLKSICASGFIL